jgi:hypothetical protein|nr:MAG TPA: hypothetical protein [Caudoviricetes sp.]
MFTFDIVFIKGQNKVILSRLVNGTKKIVAICDTMQEAQNQKIACMI